MIKPDLIKELNNYLMKPSLLPKCLHRAVYFLAKLIFTPLETEAATLVCGIYMYLFKQLISYQNIFDSLNKIKNNNNNNNNNKIDYNRNYIDADIYNHIFDNNESFTNNDQKLNHISKKKSIQNEQFITKKIDLYDKKKTKYIFLENIQKN